MMWGRPSCLLQSAGAEANRILLASALSSMRIICPNKVSRRDWIIAVSLGCFVSLRTSSFRTNWYHLMPSSIRRHHWSSASILRLSVLDIAQQSEPYRNIALYKFVLLLDWLIDWLIDGWMDRSIRWLFPVALHLCVCASCDCGVRRDRWVTMRPNVCYHPSQLSSVRLKRRQTLPLSSLHMSQSSLDTRFTVSFSFSFCLQNHDLIWTNKYLLFACLVSCCFVIDVNCYVCVYMWIF